MSTLKLQAARAQAVIPSDTLDIPVQADAPNNIGCVLYIGGAGNVAVLTVGGDSVIFVGVPAGMFFPVYVQRVLATGTTATSILALW